MLVSAQERLTYLLEQARLKTSDPEIYRELKNILANDDSGEFLQLVNAFYASAIRDAAPQQHQPEQWQHLVLEVMAADKPPAVSPGQTVSLRNRFGGWMAVAALFVVLLTGAFLWFRQDKPVKPKEQPVLAGKNDPPVPGKNGAILTLSNGQQLVLDSLGNGVIASENGAKILIRNGQLAYEGQQDETSGTVLYNTISTPRGRQFAMTLPDGSRVWLNAVSSLRYPLNFTGDLREVELSGEGYFEITANAAAPFVVKNDSLRVQVLGTAFNMMCYSDEANVRTTLVSGAVKVSRASQVTMLKPGEQLRSGDKQWRVVKADVDEVLAWKNGLFQLNKTDVATIMRQIARWYDVEVQYAGAIPGIKLEGFIKREKGLEEAIAILQASGLSCKLYDRKLIVQ